MTCCRLVQRRGAAAGNSWTLEYTKWPDIFTSVPCGWHSRMWGEVCRGGCRRRERRRAGEVVSEHTGSSVRVRQHSCMKIHHPHLQA
jgi:hypothetical protein